MKRNKEKVPEFDEIIFENRNKEYGAYSIRKKYTSATIFSILGGSGLFIALVIGLSLGATKDVIAEAPGPVIIVITVDSTLQDINKLRDEEPPKPVVKFDPYVAPEIKEKIDSGDVVLAAVATIDTTSNKPVDVQPVTEGDIEPVINTEPDPVVWVTEPPVFPGGDAGLFKFIYENIRYPEEAIENNLEGRVTLRFVVATDGSVKRVEILKGVDPVLDQEAVRVISLLPKWKPGKNNGTPAAVWFSVPVNFTLKK